MRDSKGLQEEVKTSSPKSPSKNRAELKLASDDDDVEEYKDDAKVTANQQGSVVTENTVLIRRLFQLYHFSI